MARSRRQQIQNTGAKARQGRRRGGGGGAGRGAAVGRFLRPHTGKEAGRIANSEAGTEYNPEIRNLRSQAKGSAQREKDIGAWFGQLAGEYADSQAKGNEAFKTQQDAVAKQLAEASGRSQSEQADIASKDAAFAKLVGGPQDTEGAARIAAAAGAAERSRVTLSQLPASEQANFIAALGGQRTASRLQGIEARKSESDRRQKILNDLAGVRKEKGQARVTGKEKIREADRGYSMEQRQFRNQKKMERAQLAQSKREAAISAQQSAASLALDQAKLMQAVREGKISNRQAQERIGIERRNAATTARSQRATAHHYRTENKGGLTPSERASRQEHSQDAAAAVRAGAAIRKPKTSKQWRKLEAELIGELGGSYSAEIHRAVGALQRKRRPRPSRPTRPGFRP